MEEKLKIWSKAYGLKNLKLVGYQGGYPMIQFDREDRMTVLTKSKRMIDRALRQAEAAGGMDLGVGWNFRQTSFLLIQEDSIVLCGHELVLDRILERLF